jgi:hypothetical protein
LIIQSIITITCYIIYKALMKRPEKNEIASAILDAFVPNRFENKYL